MSRTTYQILKNGFVRGGAVALAVLGLGAAQPAAAAPLTCSTLYASVGTGTGQAAVGSNLATLSTAGVLSGGVQLPFKPGSTTTRSVTAGFGVDPVNKRILYIDGSGGAGYGSDTYARIYSYDGSTITQITTDSASTGNPAFSDATTEHQAGVDQAGTLWATQWNAAKSLYKWSGSGQTQGPYTITGPTAWTNLADGDMAFDGVFDGVGTGRMWFVSGTGTTATSQIVVWLVTRTSSTAYQATLVGSFTPAAANALSTSNYVTGDAFGPDGKLYISTTGGDVYTYDPVAGTFATVTTNAGSVNGASAITDLGSCAYPQPSLSVTKTHTGNFVASQTGTYTVTVTNSGQFSTSRPVLLSDALPAGMTYASAKASDGGSISGATVGASGTINLTYTPATVIKPGESRTLTLSVNVAATATSGTNFISVGGGGDPVNGGAAPTPGASCTDSHCASDPTTVLALSDLAIDNGVSAAAIGSGGTVTYTLRIWNNGPSPTSSATVSDPLPAGLTGASVACAATGTASCGTQTISNGVLTATTGSLTLDTNTANTAPDGNFLTYTVTAAAPASGSLSNSATVSANAATTTDPTSANNTGGTVTTRIVDAVNDPAVTLTLGAGGTVSVLGNDTVGGIAATTSTAAVTISDNGGLTGLSVSGGQLVVPALAAAGTYTVTYRLCDATVTAACNTATVAVTVAPTLSGTVFEDVNYGGGAGRSLATSAGVGRPGATVELYSSTGAFVASTTTGAGGTYSFSVAPGTYTVRVVNGTVTTSRAANSGSSTAGLLGVQTFRTSAGAAEVNRVGGQNPALVDAGANTTSVALGSLTTSTATAQSLAPVTVGSANVTGIDFGFNFDTVVSTRDAGQGSLRQFILNSNALSNTGLSQSGLTAGKETSVFMIPDGTAHAGLASTVASALTNGVAVITPATVLPAITDTNTVIDGTTQTTNVGNTNSGTLGTGGTVGVDKLALSTVNRPEVQIVSPTPATTTALTIGLNVQANDVTLRGLSVLGFGTAANSDGSANVSLGDNFTGALIEGNFLGIAATRPSFDCKSGVTAATGTGDSIRSLGADGGTVQNNLIGCAAGKGFGVENTSTGWTIRNNEIRGNAIGNADLDGIDFENGSKSNVARGNLVVDHEGVGVDGNNSGGANRIENNTVGGNGIGTAASLENPGVRVFGNGSTVYRNIISGNGGAGVLVVTFNGVGATGNTISQNSIFGNGPTTGQLGIDLGGSTDSVKVGTSPFVTKNDSGDADAGGNDLLNFPVFAGASIDAAGQNLTVTGFARPGSLIELFVAAPDPTGFGEGQTYLLSLTEGATTGNVDQDTTSGTYSTAAGTDTTNRFKFVVPLSSLPGVGAGTVLTATATCLSANGCTGATSGATSEFSPNQTVIGLPLVTLTKTVRNCGAVASGTACPSAATFGTAVDGKPGDVLEYCIDYSNTGVGSAFNMVLSDNVPANTAADLNAYGSGKGLSRTVGGTTTLLTSGADADGGELTASGLTLQVGSLAKGASGRVCFRSVIR